MSTQEQNDSLREKSRKLIDELPSEAMLDTHEYLKTNKELFKAPSHDTQSD